MNTTQQYAIITSVICSDTQTEVHFSNGKKLIMDGKSGQGKKCFNGIYKINLDKLPKSDETEVSNEPTK